MSKKKIENPEADELLKHGGGGYDEAGEWYDAVQPHLENTDMDASWRLKGTDYTQRIADGTESEGLARVALNERREDMRMKSVSRKISGIMGDLTEEEQWEVMRYGDTRKNLEAQGEIERGQQPKALVHPKDDHDYQAEEKRLLLELKQKYEPAMTEAEEKELEERRLLAKLKEKYKD